MKPEHLEVSLRLERRFTDLAESLMLAQGALAVTLTDSSDIPMWEPQVQPPPETEEVRLVGLFDSDTDASALQAALSLLPLASKPEVHSLADQVWERAWMDRFKPMRFGQNLWIIPSGFEPPEPEASLLHLDPGLAFGTGSHTTTRLCLEWLDNQLLEGRRVIDLGCGSGVLGIAAAIKGAGEVLCIDNDPQAVEATMENARRNDVSHLIEATIEPLGEHASADVVVANILAGTLIDLSSEVISAIKPGGRLALSGVLTEQARWVSDAYQPDIESISKQEMGHWVLLSGKRRMNRDAKRTSTH